MLTIDNLLFSYGTIGTLRGISMQMPPGRMTCVMGRNGVGKTTLIRNIMGHLQPNSGIIRLGETDITGFVPHRRARQGLALVPQGRQIFPRLTVEENLKVGLQARRDRTRSVPAEIYDLFPVLKEMGRRMGGDLSGGQQQQLAIGRALAGDPSVLLLDEPTEGIQPNVIQQIGRVLRTLVEERQMTVVLVEQYVDFVREFGQDFYIMNRGRVVADGVTEDLSSELIHKHLSV
ncbi:MAG: urea ABC transporter ATP-binding subunit UrtE [Fuerstiella sp.]|nr:urea ABC transporter ATP-binding subunit UrtE [Fuerstiella sp.]